MVHNYELDTIVHGVTTIIPMYNVRVEFYYKHNHMTTDWERHSIHCCHKIAGSGAGTLHFSIRSTTSVEHFILKSKWNNCNCYWSTGVVLKQRVLSTIDTYHLHAI